MKPIAVIALMFVYLIASSGISGSIHYCGDTVASVSFGHNHTNKCARGSEDMKDCCHDKDFYLHLDDGHQKSTQVSFDLSKTFDVDIALVPASHSDFQLFSWSASPKPSFYHPPDQLHPRLYVLNRVFRI